MLAVAVAAAGFAVPLWAQEQLPAPDAPPNALRSTGNTYQQINGGSDNGSNSNSPPVWNVSPVNRGGVGPSLGSTQQPYGLQPNSANTQPFWTNQSGMNNQAPKYQYTPPEQPRPFGRLRKLFGGSATPTSTTTSAPAAASLPTATAMSPTSNSNPVPTTNANVGLPSAKPAKPQVSTTSVMTASASAPAPAAVLVAPRAMPVAARPDWGWHGYDNFNQLSPTSRQPQSIIQADNRSSSAIANPDLGPYMKYAHLWRPSNGSAAITNPSLAQHPVTLPAGDEGFSMPKENSPAAASGPNHGPIHSLPPGSPEGPILNPEPEGSSHVQPANYGTAAAEHRKSESLQPMDSLTVWPTPSRPTDTKPEARPAPVSPPPPPAPGSAGLPLPIREKIGEICKERARNLLVEQISPLHLRVGFVCKTQAEADAVTNHLASTPELRPYNLDYEIQIGQ
jgi:hypothetical protein